MSEIRELTGIGGATIMSVIAFSIVFIVLGGLTGIIYGIKYMAAAMERKKTGGTNPPPAGGTGSSGGTSGTIARCVGTAGDAKGHILAVLAAAVAASGGGRITSITRARPVCSAERTPWRQMGIVENLSAPLRNWKQ